MATLPLTSLSRSEVNPPENTPPPTAACEPSPLETQCVIRELLIATSLAP
jgi:hypothetical protein